MSGSVDEAVKLLSVLLEHMPDNIYFKDAEGYFTRASRSLARLYGRDDPQQVVGKTDFDFLPREDAALSRRDEMEIMRTRQPMLGKEEKYIASNGRTMWHLWTKIPMLDGRDRVVGIAGMSQDITARKEAEASLRGNEGMFRALAENSSVGFWRITPEGRTLYINPSLCRMLEIHGADQLAGKTYHEFFTAQSLAEMEIEHAKRPAGLPSTYEVEIVGKKGGRRNVLVSGSPHMNDDGTLGTLVGTFTDITHLKETEEELRREQNLMQILMDNMPDPIYFKDLESRFQRTNIAHARIMGIADPQEAIGRTDLDFFRPEDAAEFLADERKVIRTGRSIVGRIEYHGGSNGQMRWWSTTKVPIRDSEGEVAGIAGITRDITAIKRAEQEIQQLNEELELRVADRTAKLEAANKQLEAEITERREAERKVHSYQERLRSLASELSLAEERERRRIAVDLHDQIGQTLALIQIRLQAMRKTVTGEPLARELDACVELIGQPIRDTRSLVFNLSPPILYDLGLASAAAWIVDQHQGQHGLNITFKDDKRPKPLDQTVSVLLFRAIRELLTNVVKHSQARQVNVWLHTQSATLRVGVEDDGKGFSLSAVGMHGDSCGGFGLFSIREQIDRVGGTMEIDSSVGGGSRITLTVPLQLPSIHA